MKTKNGMPMNDSATRGGVSKRNCNDGRRRHREIKPVPPKAGWIASVLLVVMVGIVLNVASILAQTANAADTARQNAAAIQSLIADSVRVSDNRVRAAVEIWQKNVAAVKTGNVKQIKKWWNKEEAERGSIYDRRFYTFQKYRTTTKNLCNTIVDATTLETDCIRLAIHWQKNTAQKPVFTETLFVISESGKPVLAHALTAMTRNWPEQKTNCFTYHYYPNHRFNAKSAAAMDSLTQNLSELFHLHLDRKIPYYIFPPKNDPANFKQWNVSRSDLGEGESRISLVVDWGRDSEYSPHEIVHLLQYQLTENVPCLFLLEGMASYFGCDNASRDAFLGNFKKTLSNHSVPPVDSLIQWSYQNGDLTRREDLWIKSAGGAAAGYLYEKFGADKFKQFYIGASETRSDKANSQNYISSLKNTYQMTPSELDESYRKWLLIRVK